MGIHILAELMNVDKDKISRVSDVRKILNSVISEVGFRCLGKLFHQFQPFGVSAVYLLGESHISIHTWPEDGYIALDIFSCAEERDAVRAFELILREFNPGEYEKRIIRRGRYAKSRVQYSYGLGKVKQILLGTAQPQ